MFENWSTTKMITNESTSNPITTKEYSKTSVKTTKVIHLVKRIITNIPNNILLYLVELFM